MGGFKVTPNYGLVRGHADYYNNMGLTAEAVADQFRVSREDQDEFAYNSHMKALNAIDSGRFADEIVPFEIEETFLNEKQKLEERRTVVDTDEGPRRGTSIEALAKLRPVFADKGSVTAGNSSQTSDGAAFVMVVSEKMLKELNVQPIARFVGYAVAGVEPRIMGIGPVDAIPKVLTKTGLKLDDIDLIELNEAFASQSLGCYQGNRTEPGYRECKWRSNRPWTSA